MNTYQKIDTMHPVFRLVFAIALIMSGTLSVQAESFSYTYEGKTLNYTILSDNTCYVSTNSDVSGDIIIPETAIYNGREYSVTAIAAAAFSGCNGLTSVTISDSVTSIGDFAFEKCSGLTSMTIPNSVTIVGPGVFSKCSSLSEILVSQDSYYYSSMDGVLCSKDGSILIAFPYAKCKEYIIPNSITSIGNDAFIDCSGLTSVTIPNSVKLIGMYAFSGCKGLSSIVIPNSITLIRESTFSDCSGLTSVTIPDSVTSIDEYAFSGCYGLTEVYYNSIDPITGSRYIFSYDTYKKATLYVPDEAVEKCNAIDPWKEFNNIKAFDFAGVDQTTSDIDFASPLEVYTLGGVRMAGSIEGLAPGIYLIRQGDAQNKIAVK